jgi:hypothetical protein
MFSDECRSNSRLGYLLLLETNMGEGVKTVATCFAHKLQISLRQAAAPSTEIKEMSKVKAALKQITDL